jgi:hypothetical protein
MENAAARLGVEGARGPVAAIAVVLVVLVVLAAAFAAAADRAEAANPVAGDASWIWYVSDAGGSGAAIGRAARRHGLDAVFVKSGDGSNYWSQFDHGLVRAIHDRGVDVCAWQFVYGNSPKKEARIGARAVDEGADCLIIDAESDYEGEYAAADTYLSKLRRAIGDDYPLALSSFPYVDYHPAFPYSVFLGPDGAQYNVPQLYWYAIGDPLVHAVRHTYAFNRPYDRPQFPVGQTWQDPPKRQLLGFRRLAEAYGSKGVSWWSWQDTRRKVWPRLTGRLRGSPPGPKPRVAYANLDRGDRGDLVVWAQQLLIGRRIHVRVNGRYGKKTERGVRTVQRREKLPVTGAINDATWVALLKRKPAIMNWSKQGTPDALKGGAPPTASLAPLADEIPTAEERVR